MEKIDIVKRLLRVADRARGGMPQVTVDLLMDAASTIEGLRATIEDLREQLDQKLTQQEKQLPAAKPVQYQYECQGYGDCAFGHYPCAECIRKLV
jgi:hypothetical protein